ncbi:hypothetical protein [Salmonella bongori]|nr:hypothetical protein [Salmonella bongori]
MMDGGIVLMAWDDQKQKLLSGQQETQQKLKRIEKALPFAV